MPSITFFLNRTSWTHKIVGQFHFWWETDVQVVFRKGRGTRDQIAHIHWIIEKAREFQKNIYLSYIDYRTFHVVLVVKNSPSIARRLKRCWFHPWVRKILWRRKWQPTPVFSPEEFHGQRCLACYSLYSCTESEMTEMTLLSKVFDYVVHNKLWKILRYGNASQPCLSPEKPVYGSKSNS